MKRTSDWIEDPVVGADDGDNGAGEAIRGPSAAYLDVIIKGAKENGLPKVSITPIIIIITITVIFRAA